MKLYLLKLYFVLNNSKKNYLVNGFPNSNLSNDLKIVISVDWMF